MKNKKITIWIIAISMVFVFSNQSSGYSWNGKYWANGWSAFHAFGNSNFWNEAFLQAMSRWNNLSNFKYYYYDDYRDPCQHDNENGWAFKWDMCGVDFNTAAAVTISWINANNYQIIETDILFNRNLKWNVYTGKMNWHYGDERIYEFRRIATHELGHALGLGDQYDPQLIGKTIMYGRAHDDMPEFPLQDDINGIQAIYGGGPAAANLQVQAFVTRFYQQCLGRNPDAAGLNGWVNALLNGTLCGADVANGFIFSREFIARNTSNETFLTILYRAFFDREPDDGGFTGWISQLNIGASRQSVLDGFIYSQEFSNLCANYGISPVCSQ